MNDNNTSPQLQLNISSDSQITNVTVYPDRAAITRTFRLRLEAGRNAVTFKGGFAYAKTLPVFSRIEKDGDVTLHDLEVTEMSSETSPSQATNPTSRTSALEEEKELLQASLLRCELAPILFDNYVKQLDLQRMTIASLDEVLNAYDQRGRKWDEKIQMLKKDIHDLENSIAEVSYTETDSSIAQAEVSLFSKHTIHLTLEASDAIDAEVRLVYFVMEAFWTAEYDVAVTKTSSEDEEMELALTYKAVVTNSTAEAWKNAALKLESASFTEQKQGLLPWIVAFDDSEDASAFPRRIPNYSHALVDKANVPKGNKQTLIIAQIQPEVLYERLCTPSADYRVRVQGKITNSTEHPFCAGSAKIYLDGNYYAESQLNAIATGEVWSVPLGFDNRIHVTYPPLIKTTVETISNVSTMKGPDHWITHNCHRQTTVFNQRKVTILSLTIIDNYSVNDEGAGIASKLLVPRLERRKNLPVILTDGIPPDSHVSARWDRIQHRAPKPEDVGMLGLVNWECKIGPQREIRLDLVWTVTTTNRLGRIKGFQ